LDINEFVSTLGPLYKGSLKDRFECKSIQEHYGHSSGN